MRTRIIIIAIVVLGAAVIAVGASADFRSINDPRGDTRCIQVGGHPHPTCSDSKKRNADIVRATAGHTDRGLKHTIRVVGKLKGAALHIITGSHPGHHLYLFIERGQRRAEFRKLSDFPGPVGGAWMDFHLHSVEIHFRKRAIGSQSYRWNAAVQARGAAGTALDIAPGPGSFIRHRLG
jgi:hypothetical protein